MTSAHEITVAQLFDAFVAGDFDAAAALMSPDAVITQNGVSAPWSVTRPRLEALRPIMGPHRYEEVRVTCAGSTVLEEHRVRSTAPGGEEIDLAAAVVVRFDASGLIIAVDEYVDPTPIINLIRGRQRT